MRTFFIFIMLVFSLASFGEDIIRNNATEISKHYSALPNLYQLDATNKEKISDKITRQYILDSRTLITRMAG